MGDEAHDGLAVPGQVVLAHEHPFALGTIAVDPATRQVTRGGRSETLEPRVMQVLVVLARAAGTIVTRDELIQRCWGGRIVGDDAVNRALSRIRQLANGIAGGSFGIETIAKVGYRLNGFVGSASTAASPPQHPSRSRRRLSRRAVLGATAAAAGATVITAGGLRLKSGYVANAESRQLYDHGAEAWLQGLVDSPSQAEAYFRRAVEADANAPQAWGALALATVARMESEPDDRVEGVGRRAVVAAERALQLDPDQPDARAALALAPGYFGRWSQSEHQLRDALSKRTPLSWFGFARLGTLYAQVGRWEDAIAAYRRASKLAPFQPMLPNLLAFALWGAGRFVEAEAESARSLQLWPRHPEVWLTRMALLTYGGKPEAAMAFADDPEFQPFGIAPVMEARRLTAQAIATREPGVVQRAEALALEPVSSDLGYVPAAVRLMSALGSADEAFELIDAYYFRRGRFAGAGAVPMNPFTRVRTDFLFLPPSSVLWNDPRFDQLTRAIGLDSYWRAESFLPQYRRA